MECKKARELITKYLTGRLYKGPSRELRSHLDGCRNCIAYISTLSEEGALNMDESDNVFKKECARTISLLPDYIIGTLNKSTVDRIKEHLSDCLDCFTKAHVLETARSLLLASRRPRSETREKRECEWSFDLLSDCVYGKLNREQSRLIEHHVSHCKQCEEELILIRKSKSAWEAALQKAARARAEYRQKLFERERGRQPAREKIRGWMREILTWRRLRLSLEGAGAAAVVIFLVVTINQSRILKKQPGMDMIAPRYHFLATGTGGERIESLDEFFTYLSEHSRSGLTKQEIFYGAIEGALKTLNDPSAQFVRPEVYRERLAIAQPSYAGTGIWYKRKNGESYVSYILKDSHAEKMGIRVGDSITEINGVPTERMSRHEMRNRMRGPEGTTVTLTINREGEAEPRQFTLTRQVVEIPTVEFHLLGGNIAHLKFGRFNENTGRHLNNALKKAREYSIRGMIIDLRSTPGGLLRTGLETADKFLSEGIITSIQQGPQGGSQVFKATKDSETDYPLVVLINKDTQSAAEMVAAAIQDNKRGTIIGTRSFGKASLQLLVTLPDGSAAVFTTGNYLSPKGRAIDGVGIEPDITVEGSEAQLKEALAWLKKRT